MYPEELHVTNLTDKQIDQCNSVLDSTALAALIIHRINNSIPTSVIRESDGEQCIIQTGLLGVPARKFLLDDEWLTKYGVIGADLKEVAEELLRAGNEADYLGVPTAGLWSDKYDVFQHFPGRKQFISVFYHRDWSNRGFVRDILHAGLPMVLHRDHAEIADNLGDRYGLPNILSSKLGSWRDQHSAEEAVSKSNARTILASGGPTGKAFMVDLARKYGKVVLDVGNGITKSWCSRFVESVDRK